MKRHLLTVLLIVLSVFCCACNHPHTQLSFIAMDTYITLSADVNDGVLSSVRQKICSLSDTFDFHNSGSALSILNQNAGGPVDGDLNTLLQLARQYANDTGGAFNPALGNIIRLWDIGGQNRLPAAAQISDALAHSQSGDWQIQDGQVSLQNGVQLDLGGIAKGYASDIALQMIEQAGGTSGVLSIGGNIAVLGSKNGDDWRIAIQHPETEQGAIGMLSVCDCFVVTSGDYQRYFETHGKRYHHIFGQNGYPTDNGLRSVTVVTDSGAKADAYSTALFVMGLDQGLAFYNQKQDFEAIFITKDRSVTVTPGLRNRFTLQDGGYYYEN